MGLAARAATLAAIALLIPACNFTYTSDDPFAGPSAPQNPFILQIPINGANGVIPTNTQLAWTALPGAQSYEVQISLTSDFAQILHELTNLAIPSVFLQVGLTHATLYYWRAFGIVNGNSVLAGGSPFQFTTIGPIFGVPNPFFLQYPIGGVVSTSLTPLFLWDFSSGAAGYSFQLDVTSSFSNPLVDLPSLHLNQLQCPVTLTSQTTYYWRVTAGNTFGLTGSSPVSTSFVAGP